VIDQTESPTPIAPTLPVAAMEPPRHPATRRQPRQERGQRRVDAILDAAAALVAEEGVPAVTCHRVGRRSGTTIGSMYHFFPDRDALLHALVERHTRELRALLAQVERDAAADWPRLPTEAAVARFLDPFLAYLDAHPDFLPLSGHARSCGWTAERDAELDRIVLRLAEAVVASRCPGASPAELSGRALAMTAMAEGIVQAVARQAAPAPGSAATPAALRGELRRALVAYLDSYAAPRARRGARSS
jgi:AcrR family transcriptional regulator